MTRRHLGAGSVAVVSGAAGGLGLALAQRFARAGCSVALLDREVAAVEHAVESLTRDGATAIGLACDVTDETRCASAIHAVLERFGRIDVLVNNAGITHRSAFAATTTEVLRKVVEVNLLGAIHLPREALPALKQARGSIVAISSVAGYTPLIARTGYAASKHALHGFFESLRTELADDGVGVTMVCPSFVATGIERHALAGSGTPASHAQVVVGQRLQPDDVADRIYEGTCRGRRLLLIGRTAHAAWWLSRIAPALYERIMARRLRAEMQ